MPRRAVDARAARRIEDFRLEAADGVDPVRFETARVDVRLRRLRRRKAEQRPGAPRTRGQGPRWRGMFHVEHRETPTYSFSQTQGLPPPPGPLKDAPIFGRRESAGLRLRTVGSAGLPGPFPLERTRLLCDSPHLLSRPRACGAIDDAAIFPGKYARSIRGSERRGRRSSGSRIVREATRLARGASRPGRRREIGKRGTSAQIEGGRRVAGRNAPFPVESYGELEGGLVVGFAQRLMDAASQHLEEIAVILVALLAVATVLLTFLNVQVSRLLRRYASLLGQTRQESLVEVLEDYNERVKVIERKAEGLEQSVGELADASRRHLQGLGIVRFNAFENTGGNQSFAIAVVDGLGDGVVFSSIYGRDENRVYAKPVERGASPYALSSEEQLAVDHALQRKA